ncbi:MAG: hypothetical protein IPP67_06120 [Rhodospirillaceae bacterium]|nr:hypothetical protein [Rhodospirillaceae bacterium]
MIIPCLLIILSFVSSLLILLLRNFDAGSIKTWIAAINMLLTLWLWLWMFAQKRLFIPLAITYFSVAILVSLINLIAFTDFRFFSAIIIFVIQVIYFIKSKRVRLTFIY